MRKKWDGFKSSIAGEITSYLSHKRALGRRFLNEEMGLRLFDRFVFESNIQRIDLIATCHIDSFLASRKRQSPRGFNHLLGVVRCLFAWLVAQRIIVHSPVMTKSRRRNVRIPFILSDDEIRRLLDVAGAFQSTPQVPMRGATYKTMFALLACLGLRAGEVSHLLWRDVQFEEGVLLIREAKFFKSRIVPFGPKIGAMLRQYKQTYETSKGLIEADVPVFSFFKRRAVHPHTIGITFHSLIPLLGLRKMPSSDIPTAHCLRHSFAVRTLLRWYQSGVDPTSRLISLSTFLGHANVSSTAVYLTITDELLGEAGKRFEQLTKNCFTEGSHE